MTRAYVIDCKTKGFKIFKDDEPPTFRLSVSPLHKHEYAEVHLIEVGEIDCTVENVCYKLLPGDALLVPSGAYHRVDSDSSIRKHFSFQAELPSGKIMKKHFAPEFINDLFSDLAAGEGCIGTLAYICTELGDIKLYKCEAEQDYRHAIGNFFDKRHNEKIEVRDLADELHLSKMHTQRLVKRYTGMTFGENVRKYRLRVAEYLMKNTDMKREEIAEYVGYSSYSGFWKAVKKEG